MHIYIGPSKRSIINCLFEFCFYCIFWLWERGSQLLRKVCVEIDHLPSSSNFQMGSYKNHLERTSEWIKTWVIHDLIMNYAKKNLLWLYNVHALSTMRQWPSYPELKVPVNFPLNVKDWFLRNDQSRKFLIFWRHVIRSKKVFVLENIFLWKKLISFVILFLKNNSFFGKKNSILCNEESEKF